MNVRHVLVGVLLVASFCAGAGAVMLWPTSDPPKVPALNAPSYQELSDPYPKAGEIAAPQVRCGLTAGLVRRIVPGATPDQAAPGSCGFSNETTTLLVSVSTAKNPDGFPSTAAAVQKFVFRRAETREPVADVTGLGEEALAGYWPGKESSKAEVSVRHAATVITVTLALRSAKGGEKVAMDATLEAAGQASRALSIPAGRPIFGAAAPQDPPAKAPDPCTAVAMTTVQRIGAGDLGPDPGEGTTIAIGESFGSTCSWGLRGARLQVELARSARAAPMYVLDHHNAREGSIGEDIIDRSLRFRVLGGLGEQAFAVTYQQLDESAPRSCAITFFRVRNLLARVTYCSAKSTTLPAEADVLKAVYAATAEVSAHAGTA